MIKMPHDPSKKGRLEDRAGEESSVVAKNSLIKGMIEGTEGVRVAGHLEGDVKSEQFVWIYKGGKIIGNIDSPYIIVEGELKGDITSAEHVEIRSEAHVIGNIQTRKIAMAEGSFFRGEIHMPSKEDRPIKFVEKRQDSLR
jgi:cytoskeletal protein CcmA (bactofilin family)